MASRLWLSGPAVGLGRWPTAFPGREDPSVPHSSSPEAEEGILTTHVVCKVGNSHGENSPTTSDFFLSTRSTCLITHEDVSMELFVSLIEMLFPSFCFLTTI